MASVLKEINALLCCTGSVATIKLPLLVEKILNSCVDKYKVNVRVCMTDSAFKFCDLKDLPSHVNVFGDKDEWSSWKGRGDPVLHIELGKWADVLLIAPLDANTLGKIANGICDNLVTCVIRAWDMKKPLLFCPAMNTRMWDHPITAKQVSELESWGYKLVPCISKTLMCGDSGFGAMAEPDTIVSTLMDYISSELIKG